MKYFKTNDKYYKIYIFVNLLRKETNTSCKMSMYAIIIKWQHKQTYPPSSTVKDDNISSARSLGSVVCSTWSQGGHLGTSWYSSGELENKEMCVKIIWVQDICFGFDNI